MKRWSLLPLLLLIACEGREWRDAETRLAAATVTIRREGFEPLSGPFNGFGSFTDSLRNDWRVTLEPATPYVVGIACTAGCWAVRASVRAPDGASVAADTAATPVLAFTATQGGAYTVALSCTCEGKCWWVGQFYERGAGGRLKPGFAGRH